MSRAAAAVAARPLKACELDRRQPQSEEPQVAEEDAKALENSVSLFTPSPAKQLTRRQTERTLAGKEQYQQSAGGKRPQSNAGEGR